MHVEQAAFRGPATPLDVDDAVHLLWVYETIVATRPLSRGNREFLAVVLESCRAIADYIVRLEDGAELRALAARVAAQTVDRAAAEARLVLDALNRLRGGEDPRGMRSLYLRRPLPPLSGDYAGITVIFGPGLGMGDAITFLKLLKRLGERYPRASFTIHDLYPGLWPRLLPRANAGHYRGRPLRPFVEVAAREPSEARHLVVVIDFDGYYFHERGLARRRNQDVLEISLGLRKVWLARGDSPWVDVDVIEGAPFLNNYWVVHELARRLLHGDVAEAPWAPIVSRSRRIDVDRPVRLLFNPHSSKPVPLAPSDWRKVFSSAMRSLRHRRLEVSVLPGLDATSRKDATAIASAIDEVGGVTATLFDGAAGNTPFSMIPAIVDACGELDACLTIDTFSAHLVPLFDVPTAVVTLKSNPEFWVPGRRVFYVLVQELERRLAPLLVRILSPHTPSAAARALELAVDRAAAAPSAETFDHICEALTLWQPTAEGRALRDEGARWLRFWSRVSRAVRHEPAQPEHLLAYPHKLAQSELFKLAVYEG